MNFRKVLRSLNIYLTSKEIDGILNILDTKSLGYIFWEDFYKKIRPSNIEEQLTTRVNLGIMKINSDINYYMLSPKDAFRQFNVSRTGKMTFEEFIALLHQISVLAKKEDYSYAVSRDIFEYIDDKVIKLIARNRKTLGNQTENRILNIESAVNILNNFLTKNKIFISDMELRKMIKFA